MGKGQKERLAAQAAAAQTLVGGGGGGSTSAGGGGAGGGNAVGNTTSSKANTSSSNATTSTTTSTTSSSSSSSSSSETKTVFKFLSTSLFRSVEAIQEFADKPEVDRLSDIDDMFVSAVIPGASKVGGGGLKLSKSSDTLGNLGMLKQSKSSDMLANLGGMGIKKTVSTDSLASQGSSQGGNDFDPLIGTDIDCEDVVVSDLLTILSYFGHTSAEGLKILTRMKEQVSGTDFLERGLTLLKFLVFRDFKLVEPHLYENNCAVVHRLLMSLVDKSNVIRETASDICSRVGYFLCPYGIFQLYEVISPIIMDSTDWRLKVGALQILRALSPRAVGLMSSLLPRLVPEISECMIHPKKEVAALAMDTLTSACKCVSNEDILHLVPQLIRVIAHPDESSQTIDALLETTFVSNIDAPTLALISPLLNKAMKNRASILKRKACRIMQNMCKLVIEPANVAPFIPLLLPSLNKVIDEVMDFEVRDVAIGAKEILIKAIGEVGVDLSSYDGTSPLPPLKLKAFASSEAFGPGGQLLTPMNELESLIDESLRQAMADSILSRLDEVEMEAARPLLKHIVKMVSQAVVYHSISKSSLVMNARSNPAANTKDSNSTAETAADRDKEKGYEPFRYVVAIITNEVWKECSSDYIAHLYTRDILKEDSIDKSDLEGYTEVVDGQAMSFRLNSLGNVLDCLGAEDADETNLCNIEFTLAFGGKTLLHNTRLKLGKGRRYGIMGKNGTGKTTLLTNIGSGNIEGMNPALKTIYVQHDDATEDNGVPLLEELIAYPPLAAMNVTREEASEMLTAINFTPQMLANPRSSLSGGWKMKLLIIRAMLMRADVLLLDEPTNHLDAASVTWLTQYLISQPNLSCMVVSHDITFLDNIVTDIIHYENLKLVYYHGNMTNFVKIHPEAKHYYELDASSLKFEFPTPDRLDGISSTTKSILKIENVTFTYPGNTKPSVYNASVKISLGSRVAVIGPNGAGKSTLIKLLVQETEADLDASGNRMGEVWKHQNLRIAYVAQHSFHHVEQHLDSSPCDYFKWRFDKGVDKENLMKTNAFMTKEEEKELKTRKKEFGDPEELLGRRKNGKVIEYECTWWGQGPKDPNRYIPVDELVEHYNFAKQVAAADARINGIAAGLDLRPLLNKEIQAHLDNFNLEAEYGTHSNIRRLSGGQKVKLVLAAAMWNKPHCVVLDEPTNYLDREALGALTQAIKGFAGGVLIISHNKEFTDAICTEVWNVENGIVKVEGEVEDGESGGKVKSKSLKTKNSTKLEIANTLAADQGSTTSVGAGNVNSTKDYSKSSELIQNPKTLNFLTKVEMRKLAKLAQVAGVSLKEYVSKLNRASPEWKWL